MHTDFLDAHDRHREDGERLFKVHRWANADHLYGLAAECGLKRLMLIFGMPYDTARDRPDKSQDREHANGIWDRFESYRCGRLHYDLPTSNPFHDWNASQRYAHQSSFDQKLVQSHRAGAQEVCRLIQQAKRDGIL